MNRLVIGCGYLGLPIARKWIASGDQVYAITRQTDRIAELKSHQIVPIVADILIPESLSILANLNCELDTVLIAVGMDRSSYSDIHHVYVEGLKNTLANLPTRVGHLVYISSTGVYGDFGGDWIDEESPAHPLREGGRACLAAEQVIKTSPIAQHSTILRFAGIYGPGRVPTRQSIELNNWRAAPADRYLNLIHVDDGANIIETIADQTPSGQTFLVSDGHPPLRREYYTFIATHHGIEAPFDHSPVPPTKNARATTNKRISNRKLLRCFPIKFKFPNYRAGLKQALP